MKIALVVALGTCALVFQNCSRAEFHQQGSSFGASKASLTPVAAGSDLEAIQNGDSNAEVLVADTGTSPSTSTSGLVACILVDHGKSLKLGLLEGDLHGEHSVAHTVCISRKACLEIVSTKFTVQGAYDRGYCDHNPNVIQLSDAEVTALCK